MTTADSLLDELDAVVGSFALHLRTRDVARGVDALRGVGEAVRKAVRDGVLPPRISPVAPLPDGPIIRLDDLPTDPLTRRRIADAVDDLVVEAGFDPGAALLCEVDGLADLDECPRAAVLRLFPEPGGSAGDLPATWIDLAAEWVFGDQAPETLVRLRVLGVEASVMAKEAAGILHGCARARAWCDVVTGDVHSRVRTASISFGIAPHVAVAAGGPRCDDNGLLARFELLAEVARDHAGTGPRIRGTDRAAYACLDFEDTFGDLGTGLSNVPWADERGASPNRVAGRLVDRYVPEVFPYQVLGPRHAEALGDALREDLRSIGDDRWELAFGDPGDWLPDAALREDLRRDGWRSLAPLLLRTDQLDEALAVAGGDADQRAPREVDGGTGWSSGLPDLSTIVIEPHSHPRRSTRLTVLELAAWLAGEPHSDDPANVSPVLRVYVRELAAGLDDDRRQVLRDLASGLAGTGAFDDRTEHARSWLLADRLLRVHARAWLAAAGLTESADRIGRLESIVTDTQLVRGVHLLGNAIGTASRRLETTRSIAGARADVVDALSWEIWEDVAQRTGWAATAEAVVHGVPGALTFATDQRVMECSRDPDQRAEVDSSTRGLGDEVWATALGEVAATAWRSGWDVAEAFVHHESTFSLRTALRNSLHAMLDVDDIALDMLLDDVDRAARDTIARLLLIGDDESDHWDKAVAAAGRVDGGDAWLAAIQEVRAVLGPGLCDEAVQTARGQLREWSARAPQLVSRAVVASVTREACSVAGRGVIARAAAEALGHGGSEADAEDAARAAVASLVDQLGDDAVAAVGDLIDLRT